MVRGARAVLPRAAQGRRRRRSTRSRPPARSPARGLAAPASPVQRRRSAPTGASPSVSADLGRFKAIKNEAGGTVNDVVLAAVSGALGRYLRSRGHSTQDLELRAMVPISVRADGRARRPRQPRLVVHGAAPGLVRGPARAPAPGQRRDGRPEGVQAGGRRHDDDRALRLRPADDRRPGRTPAAGSAVLQPRRHQRPRPPVPALPDGPQARADLPDGAARAQGRRSASGS